MDHWRLLPATNYKQITNKLKSRVMKKEFIHFICPVYYLPYIFNADMEGLTDEEIKCIDTVLNGYNLFEVEGESFFAYKNDFNNLGAECITLTTCK
jgi:hypothetical protein